MEQDDRAAERQILHLGEIFGLLFRKAVGRTGG